MTIDGMPADFKGFDRPSSKKVVDNAKRARDEKLEVDLDKYIEFVDVVTSGPSKDYDMLLERYAELHNAGCKIERLDAAASGLVAESGKFMELVKKIKFQGKEWNEDVRDHLMTEHGDVMWYAAQACMALNLGFEEVIFRNTVKLAARYPEGEFTVVRSEEREEGDR